MSYRVHTVFRITVMFVAVALGGQAAAAAIGERINPDAPRHGTWDFAPALMWKISELQGEAFATPAELRVASDGTLFFRDFSHDRSYVLDSGGQLVRAIAPVGAGIGEVSRYLNCFVAAGQMAVGTPEALHFFDLRGEFVASYPNNLFSRFPGAFLNEREFLCSSGQPAPASSGYLEIQRVELDGDRAEVFATIPCEGAAESRGGGVMLLIRGVTPQVEFAYDADRGRIYCGRNDRYLIHAIDANGDRGPAFGIARPPLPLSEDAKRAHFADLDLPDEASQDLMKGLPDVMTCFRRIQVVNDLVLVTATTGIDRQPDQVHVDVFSPEGQYLYRAPIRFGGDEHIFGSADNLVIHGDSFYVALEDDAGRKSLARYRVRLPD